MRRRLVFLLALSSCPVSQAGLLTNFEESYALYQKCTMDDADYDSDGDVDGHDFMKWQRGLGLGLESSNINGDGVRDGKVDDLDMDGWATEYGLPIPLDDPVCFKLYLDPEGIIDGEVTAFVDAPDPGPGQTRFNSRNNIIARHPQYNVNVLNTQVLLLPGRMRLESTIQFLARNPADPPAGPITVFGYEVHDALPQAGLDGVVAGFEFKGTNHITTFDPTTGITSFFNESQLQDVPLPIARPLLQATDTILAIDIDPPTSNSSYPVGETPEHSLDQLANTKYLNFGKRNTGLIVVQPQAGPSIARSMVLTTANDFPDRDPITYELYGTDGPVHSLDNSDGMAEPWQLISSGVTNLPIARGISVSIGFPAPQFFNSYRIVFPEIRNFRNVNSMQIADVALFESSDGSGPSLFNFSNDARAIQFPTVQADSPLNEGPEKALDGNPNTKYLNRGKENSGLIVSPSFGPTIVTSFEITTANDAAGRDPASWALYGTNDLIVSGNFSQGVAENWQLIDQGLLNLPDARLTVGPVVVVDNTASYASYRLVFPTVKNPAAPGVNSVQFADIQFFGFAGMSQVPVPEPAAIALAACATGLIAFRRRPQLACPASRLTRLKLRSRQ
jgi:hypothetical protein